MKIDHAKLVVISCLASFTFAASVSSAAPIETEDSLKAVLQKRLLNDRTGVCVTAAIIAEKTIKATACANAKSPRKIDDNTAFEIGSITKTMTATLLADMIERGEMKLDAPLADYLPKGTVVPSFEGKPILLRHVVIHTSGLAALPPDFAPKSGDNPYADLTEKSVLASLGKVTLQRAPGAVREYSNFAMILLGLAIANKAGASYETLLRERIFIPLAMKGAYVNDKPPHINAAVGHSPNQMTTAAWTSATNLAGAGAVKATLADMVQYAKAQLGNPNVNPNVNTNDNTSGNPKDNDNSNGGGSDRKSAVAKAIAKTQQKMEMANMSPMGMNWFVTKNKGEELFFHGGGTGGFSTELLINKKAQRAVVVLADTSLTNLGGVSDIALHLLNAENLLGEARVEMPAPESLLDALAGDYVLDGSMKITLRKKTSGLTVQAEGQSEFEMGFDSRGDFFPRVLDAALRPEKFANRYRFTWLQGGGAQIGVRVLSAAEKAIAAATAASVSTKDFERYVGTYNLVPNFDLNIFIAEGKFYVQATNQPKFLITPIGGAKFFAEQVPAEIEFFSTDGTIFDTLELTQNGRKNKARRVIK